MTFTPVWVVQEEQEGYVVDIYPEDVIANGAGIKAGLAVGYLNGCSVGECSAEIGLDDVGRVKVGVVASAVEGSIIGAECVMSKSDSC
eukprot:CAMPEP_0201886958 /NCGR_PEP_ID=MMETSP0902-20130614/23698_1 /ASSEMBLY_ACC=CAM_ASM_000551 /TAXON_ID=420261 /ORGANISM="Thalassiosira antarctica, Strain CCMP982" /LENGTH=87 /DNA_ID=CAMNT_0048416727 /DNA_START=296 /DNA_END=560 /DNA_ORIENTATION=+